MFAFSDRICEVNALIAWMTRLQGPYIVMVQSLNPVIVGCVAGLMDSGVCPIDQLVCQIMILN
jgi:type III secretory pathway component EscS